MYRESDASRRPKAHYEDRMAAIAEEQQQKRTLCEKNGIPQFLSRYMQLPAKETKRAASSGEIPEPKTPQGAFAHAQNAKLETIAALLHTN